MRQAESLIDPTQRLRRLCMTVNDRFGWMPSSAEIGDDIVIFHGARMPFVIRPVSQGPVESVGEAIHYELIGECFLHGVMDGEAVREDQAQMITLC